MNKYTDLTEYFRFRPIKAARVSEVSEATASSDVPVEERVNFHIGNPVQQKSLSSAYLRMALGLPIADENLSEDKTAMLLEAANWNESEKPKLEFLLALIKKSAPYMPRGGYNRKDPGFLVKHFSAWLAKEQREPLSYDLGETSGRREIILSTGGKYESLRLFFHSLSSFALVLPVQIMSFHFDLPEHLKAYSSLHYNSCTGSEEELLNKLNKSFTKQPDTPIYLLLGKLTSEITRRSLRELSLIHPVFFVEVNDAPNHQSLAREAKMMNRVLRILTPGIFSSYLESLSVSFIAGNPDLIKVMETMQFQLKGTPSASEVELLTYILRERVDLLKDDVAANKNIIVKPKYESQPFISVGTEMLSAVAKKYETKVADIIGRQAEIAAHAADIRHRNTSSFSFYSERAVSGLSYDLFAERPSRSLMDEFFARQNDPEWKEQLVNSFLHSFLRHHPEYKIDCCQLVSGSSRTGLGLLGFHCGIEEVIIPDLSWTYEHCFPRVTVVPLTDDLEIDANGIIEAVERKIAGDPNWRAYGAVALNNPHNATGGEFDPDILEKLIVGLLNRGVRIVDDLSYQNVSPSLKLREIKTVRQITDRLSRAGYISSSAADLVITVHSLSKTDSLAGARLSVIELREPELFNLYKEINSTISPNLTAVLLTYLFYRNTPETVDAYWRLRNRIFFDRMQAIEEAVKVLPKDRNIFDIVIKPPKGSMYPRMIIRKLPVGLSLDWLASGLARQGIGLVPLSTFARTEKGFETARTTFRLTLGGTDDAETLLGKTRRVLIDLNRMIAEESASYRRREYKPKSFTAKRVSGREEFTSSWNVIENKVRNSLNGKSVLSKNYIPEDLKSDAFIKRFEKEYLPERLLEFRQRFEDKLTIHLDKMDSARADKGSDLVQFLAGEFYKDSLGRKESVFLNRLYDRTVHPTQMYSIKAEACFENITARLFRGQKMERELITRAADELLKEYAGMNVAIVSGDEAGELILDLDSLITAEDHRRLYAYEPLEPFISFWSDWDGSSRPSGQGHSLIAAVLIENVIRQAGLLQTLMRIESGIKIPANLMAELNGLAEANKKFSLLLKQITQLTNQLEKRYRGVLPFNIKPGRLRGLGMKLRIARDPLTTLWQHNDSLERKMLDLRNQRRDALEYYFNLNKQLRKSLYSFLPAIQANINDDALCREACLYHDLMKRFVITPRIHQKMITAQDQFAIDTTVNNIHEINQIAGRYGNPGMVMGLQISMSTKPEALITLNRKMRAIREQKLREDGSANIPPVWLIPLFEDRESVDQVKNYLNKIWEYSLQSRRMNQETADRFSEIMCEVFVAGSDLSQQTGQAPGMELYRTAKYDVSVWLAEKGLAHRVRMKMGSGEPMQRQGGYYTPYAGRQAFIHGPETVKRFAGYLKASTRKSTEYAVTPMIGVYAGGDLRTYQSAVSEKLRYLNPETLSKLLYHVAETQKFYRKEIIRAAEPLVETRLQFKSRGLKELERLTRGRKDTFYEEFLSTVTENFRQILYGRDEDVAGIHIISYFIARTTPPLRDRPTIRPGQGVSGSAGRKILEKIADTIPLSRYGSMLRAIAHNQSQTAVLGIPQLTTGLFRALDSFSQRSHIESEARSIIEDRILPNLPVYEILHTLRIYHDTSLEYLNKMEKAFPAGNSAFLALREDIDSINKYLVFFQRELLRRHGLNVSDFFEADKFISDLLPTLRPDLAVLLQPDFFNSDPALFFAGISGNVDINWKLETEELLAVPAEISAWRSRIWSLLEEPVYQRVAGFVELAISLYSLSSANSTAENIFGNAKLRVPANISGFFSSPGEDNMRQFLAAAFEFLTALSHGMVEVPVNIVRALKEVERIIKIEEQALAPRQQELLRFYLLQIARLAGENG